MLNVIPSMFSFLLAYIHTYIHTGRHIDKNYIFAFMTTPCAPRTKSWTSLFSMCCLLNFYSQFYHGHSCTRMLMGKFLHCQILWLEKFMFVHFRLNSCLFCFIVKALLGVE